MPDVCLGKLLPDQLLEFTNGWWEFRKLIWHHLERSVDLVLREAFKVTKPKSLGLSLCLVL